MKVKNISDKSKLNYKYDKLKGRIIEKYGTQDEFSKAIGITRETLSMKLNNKRHFTQPEIDLSINLLGIDAEEINEYFFIR